MLRQSAVKVQLLFHDTRFTRAKGFARNYPVDCDGEKAGVLVSIVTVSSRLSVRKSFTRKWYQEEIASDNTVVTVE